MYARMAWGYAHVNLWDPFVSAWFWGVHLSPIMLPLGVLGAVFDVVPVLLTTQALVVSLCASPLSKLAVERFGPWAGPVTALIWLLHPNLGHVATDEFHPGTLAVLPLTWAAYALDRRDHRLLKWSVIGILACREDLALVAALIGVLAMRTHESDLTRTGRKIAVISIAYFAVFSLVLLPIFGPQNGSLSLHFGKWGDSLPQVAWHLLSHPADLLTHISAPHRAWYIPTLVLTVGVIFPWLQPKWLLLATPLIAINLLSEFPGVTRLDSHYLTPALPFIVVAAIDGAHALGKRFDRSGNSWLRKGAGLMVVLGFTMVAHIASGGMPWSLDYNARDFREDARSLHAKEAVALVPAGVGVQAPDALLSHLAERDRVHRGPPPDMTTKFVILDIAYRRQYAPDGTVLRTAQDPNTRAWLARPRYALMLANPDFAVLEQGRDPRHGPLAARYVLQRNAPKSGAMLTQCLFAVDATLKARTLNLRLWAQSECPSDLALRIGHQNKPRRIELPFDGLFSPAHLRHGDIVKSTHSLTTLEAQLIRRHGLRIGAIRSSGARPEPSDPDAIAVPVRRSPD